MPSHNNANSILTCAASIGDARDVRVKFSGATTVKCHAIAGDEQLIKWHKQEQPIIPHPPENMKLTGFRDPYVIQKGDAQKKWKMLLGSGVEGQGGTLLVYEASDLGSGSCAADIQLQLRAELCLVV